MKELFRELFIVDIGRLESLLFEKHVVKAGQDHTCHGNDITGRSLCDAGYAGGQLDELAIGIGEFYDGIVQPANDGREAVSMLPAESHLESLVIGNFVTNDGGDHIIRLVLSPFKKQFFAVFRIEILSGQEVFNDGGSGFAESVREDRAEGDIGDSEGILEPHLLTGALIDKLVAVTEKFPEFADFFARDVTGRDNVELEKVSDPHGILVISLLALNSPDVFRVGDDGMKVPFQDIKDGDPVFAGGFHADFGAVVFKEPVTAGSEVRVKSGETLFLISGDAFEISGGDTDSNKFFMDVHTGTVVVNNTQHKKPPFKRSRH